VDGDILVARNETNINGSQLRDRVIGIKVHYSGNDAIIMKSTILDYDESKQ
jgi:hypothetical protein